MERVRLQMLKEINNGYVRHGYGGKKERILERFAAKRLTNFCLNLKMISLN